MPSRADAALQYGSQRMLQPRTSLITVRAAALFALKRASAPPGHRSRNLPRSRAVSASGTTTSQGTHLELPLQPHVFRLMVSEPLDDPSSWPPCPRLPEPVARSALA